MSRLYDLVRGRGIGRAIPFSQRIDRLCYRLAVDDRTTVETWFGATMYIKPQEYGISRQLYRRGYTQPELTAFVRRTVGAGDSVVDVGSHIGYFTLLFADIVGAEGRVDAFEPLSSSYRLLEQNVAENGLDDAVRMHPHAAYDRVTEVSLGIDPIDHGRTSIRDEEEETETATTVTLDETVDGDVDFVKIDAEGTEDRVIAGMDGIIAESRPTVAVEYNPTRWDPEAVARPFRERGYEMEWIVTGGETEPVRRLPDAAEYERTEYEEIVFRPP